LTAEAKRCGHCISMGMTKSRITVRDEPLFRVKIRGKELRVQAQVFM